MIIDYIFDRIAIKSTWKAVDQIKKKEKRKSHPARYSKINRSQIFDDKILHPDRNCAGIFEPVISPTLFFWTLRYPRNTLSSVIMSPSGATNFCRAASASWRLDGGVSRMTSAESSAMIVTTSSLKQNNTSNSEGAVCQTVCRCTAGNVRTASRTFTQTPMEG